MKHIDKVVVYLFLAAALVFGVVTACGPSPDPDYTPAVVRESTRQYTIWTDHWVFHCDQWRQHETGDITLNMCEEGSEITIVNPLNVVIVE